VPWLQGTRWINAVVDQRLPWGHHLLANYRSRTSGSSFLPSSDAFRVEYAVPLGVPLKQSSDTGRVTLSLHDADTGGALADFLVQIGEQSLLTDRNGVADFSGLKPGTYYVALAPGALGPKRTTLPALPARISVVGGRRMQIDATVVRTMNVTGVLQLFQGAALQPARGVPGAIIEATGGGARRVAVTDAQGRFAFENMAPGSWRIGVVRAELPAFYQVEERERTLTFEPGEDMELVLRVVPKPVVLDTNEAVSSGGR
jgi:uncharacterized surface anchored protein